MTALFSRSALMRHLARARTMPQKDHDFLWRHTAEQLRDRLLDIRRDFPQAVEWGTGASVLDADMRAAKKIDNLVTLNDENVLLSEAADGFELWPVQEKSCDVIVAHNHMHWISDVPGVLTQMHRSLRPDGVLIGSFFGGDSLYELRQSIAAVELEIYGGMSPRVSPFASLQDVAALMQRAGFALPVVDQERVTVTYADITALIRDLRGMGQTHATLKRDKRILRRDFWPRVDAHYRQHYADARGRLMMSVEIFYVLGWAPDASQPVPLQRGSATHSLADVLKEHE